MKWLYIGLAVLTGLLGAALLHILIILVLPYNTGSDAWSKVVSIGEPFEFYALANQDNPTELFNEDINIQTAVCPYDLEEGPVLIVADDPTTMWTFATYDTESNEVFSMSARSAINGEVNFLIVTKAQLLTLRREEPDLVNETIAIEVDDIEGYVILRSIVPSLSALAEARNFLTNASCARL